MIMYVGQGGTYMVQFSSQMECSRALLEFSAVADDLAEQYNGDVWASCVRTWAPSELLAQFGSMTNSKLC
jgi:hypothetical protein